jgi:hypothetical protein
MLGQIDLAGSFTLLGSAITVNRLGYGAMQLAGRDGNKLVWDPPRDIDAANRNSGTGSCEEIERGTP